MRHHKSAFPVLFVPAALALTPVAAAQTTSDAAMQASIRPDRLHGIWGMVPLHNGIANVVEYLPGGVSRLHIFDCAKLGPPEVESYSYVVSATGRSIHVSDGSGYSFAMDVIAFDERGTRLDVVIGGQGSFTYQKLENVAPLCELYRSPDLP